MPALQVSRTPIWRTTVRRGVRIGIARCEFSVKNILFTTNHGGFYIFFLFFWLTYNQRVNTCSGFNLQFRLAVCR